MNLFPQATPKADPEKIREIKAWVYEILEIDEEIPISISQLRCTEPDCPPVETVIAVMTSPAKQYKIHQPVDALKYRDVSAIQYQ
jgi:hypothetical protein